MQINFRLLENKLSNKNYVVACITIFYGNITVAWVNYITKQELDTNFQHETTTLQEFTDSMYNQFARAAA